MKRLSIILIALVLLLAGCAPQYRTDITREEIVAAYEDAGYSVSSRVYDEKLDHGEIAYIQADHPNGDYIYFSIFETEKEAQAYKAEYYHPVVMSLFSVIYGQPSWPRWGAYGCIVVEYDQPEYFGVFEDLLKSK